MIKSSRPARGAWIEIHHGGVGVTQAVESRPARGAWIEMSPPVLSWEERPVAPRKGRVD